MVAFNKTNDLPASITTVEQVLAWAGLLMQRSFPQASNTEVAGQDPINAFSTSVVRLDNDQLKLVVRAVIPLDEGYAESANKLWADILQQGEVSIPDAYKS